MKNRKATEKQIKNIYCEHHSNLALLTTAVAMITFMVFMLIYMGTFQSGNYSMSKVDMAMGVAKVVAVACWIITAGLCVLIATKKKKYLVEYAAYSLVMGFGLFFMYNMPMFIYNAFSKFAFARSWAKTVFTALSLLSAIYFVVSVSWHLVLATPGKSKKK